MADYDVKEAFREIETELLESMMRNMKRHRAEETEEGFEWAQWQALQLKSLDEYKKRNRDKFKPRFKDINKKIRLAILKANAMGKMAQEAGILNAIKEGFSLYKKADDAAIGEFFKTNDRKLDALIRATEKDMERAETAILRMSNDQYRKAIFNAQVYANTGAGTYEKAVDMAVKSLLSSGLNCVMYKDGSRHTLDDYADMAVRTAGKRAYLQGEGVMRQKWGVHTVIMNKRGNPCPKCLPWVGKILIDDVWSGGTSEEAEEYGYQLMSTAIDAGLYHPRCMDSHTTYFEGISSTPDSNWTKTEIEDLKKKYQDGQKQQYTKRQADKFERLEKAALDEDDRRQYSSKKQEWRKKEVANGNNRDIMESDLGRFKEKLRNDDEITSEYYDVLKKKFSHGRKDAKKMFVKYASGDTIEDAYYFGVPFYDTDTKKISLNYEVDSRNSRGGGATWFHEHGHFIDNAAGVISDDEEYMRLLEKDAFEYRVKYGAEHKLNTFDKVDSAISSELNDTRKHSAISDIMEGVTKGNISGCAGHSAEYWEQKENITAEAFAHMFEAQFDEVRYGEMKKYFPKSLEYFEKKVRENLI